MAGHEHTPHGEQRRVPCLLLALALASASAVARAGDVFKYVDSHGTVTYSAVKPAHGAFERLTPDCLVAYDDCNRSDWGRVPLNRTAYQRQILASALRYDLDPALLRAVVQAESDFNAHATSKAGAQGLMQLMPQVQQLFGVTDPYDVAQNLDAGAHLLKSLLDRYDNNVKFAIAAYSAGTGAVARYNGIPPYPETRNYVRRVTRLYTRYQRASF